MPLSRIVPELQKGARDRVLSLDELGSIGKAVVALSDVHRAALRILILMPFRKTELLSCHWRELEGGWLSIPASRAKTNEPRKLFISDFAAAQLPARRNDSQLIFTTNGRDPTRLGRQIKAKPGSAFGLSEPCVHDMRRAFGNARHAVSAPHHSFETL